MQRRTVIQRRFILAVLLIATTGISRGQQAEVSGFVRDPSGQVIAGATVTIQNQATAAEYRTTTNEAGIYTLPPLPAGIYKLTASAPGFDAKVIDDLRLQAAAKISLHIDLPIASTNQTVTVDGSGIYINTVDATVGTTVDRRFVENMPLSGRSFQSLMTMVPGVSVVPSQGVGRGGEISVNGQRTEANYFTVDGVSANTGTMAGEVGLGLGAGYSGSVPGHTALGTTQSMVSIDALEEFRATTSTYSAEYGRGPGGQFSLTTRSGTNDWHGSAFNYLRNDKLDAANWFDNANGLPKQLTKQNDFGGTLGGPLFLPKVYDGKDRTFFFFSYEGLRLRAPQAAITTEVPTLEVRRNAPAELRPFLNAFPIPNGPVLDNGNAHFTSGYTSPSSLDSTSLRVDHSLNPNVKLFGRFSSTPSSVVTRSIYGLSERNSQELELKTLTLGATAVFSPRLNNDFRFGSTWNDATSVGAIDNFGGATPLSLNNVPGMGGSSPGWLYFRIPGNRFPTLGLSPSESRQRQLNVVETMNLTVGRHALKWGIDYRRTLTRVPLPKTYIQVGYFDQESILTNQPGILRVFRSEIEMQRVYSNFSAFLQDEWRVNQRLTLSLGLRWDLNPAPRDAEGNQPFTVDQIKDLSRTAVAPRGSDLWKTTYNNFAPRVGVAYQVNRKPGFETVLRGGAGVFYDTGNTLGSRGYFYGVGITTTALFTSSFPLTQSQLDSIPAPSPDPPYRSNVVGFDPELKLPYTVQWNVAVEQGLGSKQTVTMNYVGSAGRRLLADMLYYPGNIGNPNFAAAEGLYSMGLYLTTNRASSDYQALQVKFQRKLSQGLQALASWTWSHSIDNASTNFTLSQLLRGNSDFDLRHNLQAAITYDIPGRHSNRFVSALLKDWSADVRVFARTAAPVNIVGTTGFDPGTGANLDYQPNRVLGQPLYLDDPNAPGGRRINPAAFEAAGEGQQGNLGRNVVRGFGAFQTDIALRREFPFGERVRLQFRAEAFNVFNRANFGSFYNQLADPLFGTAANTLNGQLGGLNPLYQVGGPRSMQLALRLHF
jgi:TonB-dependent Receptor Plug Domain.